MLGDRQLTLINMNRATPATINRTLKNFEIWYLFPPNRTPRSNTARGWGGEIRTLRGGVGKYNKGWSGEIRGGVGKYNKGWGGEIQ